MFNHHLISRKQIVSFLIVFSFFIFALSPSLKSIFLPLTLLAILSQSSARHALMRVIHEPWCIALLLLFGLIVIGCLQNGADWQHKLMFINKYSKLLYLPVLAVGFQNKRIRELAIHAFLAAMLITLIISTLKFMRLVKINPVDDPGAVFQNHIVTGYYMAFAAYLAAYYSWQQTGKMRFFYLTLTLLFSFQTLFINTGRTGYVMYAILTFLFLLQCIPLRKIPLYLLVVLPLLAFTAYHSMTLTRGVSEAVHDVQNFETGNKNTSVGFRLQFHQYAKKLFLASPMIGQGTASFSYHFQQDQPIPAWGTGLLDPHNQYWLMAAENGILGVLLLLYFFLTLFYACRNLKEMRPLMIAVLCTFIAANLSDSFLLYSSTGFFLILFSALGLSESINALPLTIKEDSLQLSSTACFK